MTLDILTQLPMSGKILRLIILGILIATGFILGRAFCGKVCPIGFLQDLIYKIPFPVKIKKLKGDKYLRYIKYIVLLLFIVLMALGLNSREITQPPVIAVVIILTVAVFAFIIMRRPFCKYLCHFGAVLGAGNKTAIRKYKIDTEKCIKCGVCVKACKMDIVPYDPPNQMECIHCDRCENSCPCKAISKLGSENVIGLENKK
ncbi:MAG: 4Fe-4S ferredoxin iron-sulfur binding protein [Clostridia bacterium]|jgi:polyferredoxin|nr:4Fe-4S ferredoxin iron-sulfur binding protein [Clostridia bacterium]